MNIENEFISLKFDSDNTATLYFRDNLHVINSECAYAIVRATKRYNERMLSVKFRDNMLTYISDVRSIVSCS